MSNKRHSIFKLLVIKLPLIDSDFNYVTHKMYDGCSVKTQNEWLMNSYIVHRRPYSFSKYNLRGEANKISMINDRVVCTVGYNFITIYWYTINLHYLI